LIFNGLLKIPMAVHYPVYRILIFVFYQFNQAPLMHNRALQAQAMLTAGVRSSPAA